MSAARTAVQPEDSDPDAREPDAEGRYRALQEISLIAVRRPER